MKETDNFYLSLKEPNYSCMLALRSIILGLDNKIDEILKWQTPCFCYNNRMLCFLCIEKKTGEPYILVADGRLIHHPMLEAGTRKRMKTLKINPNGDLPFAEIVEILNAALDLFRKRIIKVK